MLAGLLELGIEVAGSTVVVAGEGPAHAYVVQTLARLGARVLVAAPETAGRIQLYGGEKAGDGLADDAVTGRLAESDALVLCPVASGERWVGPGARTDAARLAAIAPHLAVVGLDADADLRALGGAGVRCRPAGGPDGLFDLLPQAVVAQHTAGLRVGEAMTKARQRGSSPVAAEQLAADRGACRAAPQGPERRPALTTAGESAWGCEVHHTVASAGESAWGAP